MRKPHCVIDFRGLQGNGDDGNPAESAGMGTDIAGIPRGWKLAGFPREWDLLSRETDGWSVVWMIGV